MWRSKKFIVIAVLSAVVLVGSIGGVVLAQTENEDSNLGNQRTALLERVSAIYQEKTGNAIDPQVLEDSFTQAQSELRDEALDNYLQKLVDEGKITQDEADQYKTWRQARPDVSIGFGFRGHGGFRGMGGPGFFGGPCAPAE